MSFPKYPAYTDSGVEWIGEIPAHWSLQRCKQVFIERDERSETGEEMLLSVSAYTGISPRGEIINDGDFLSRAQSLVGYKICYPNDLVMNIMLAWNRGLGFSNYYGIVSPAYSVFKLLPGNCTRFLDYLVRSDEAILYYKAFSSGVIDSRLRLYPNIFGSLYYALPPLPEQQAIASFLDRECGKIDGLIAEQERLIALLAEKRQAVISHAVTKGLNPNAPMKDSGIPWIGMVPEGWDVVTAGRVVRVISGFAFPSDKFLKYGEGVPLLRGVNVGVGKLRWDDVVYWKRQIDDGLDIYELKEGDIVIGMDRPWISSGLRISKIYKKDLPCLLLQRVGLLRSSKYLNSSFLMYQYSLPNFMHFLAPEMTGVSVPHISPSQIASFPICLPSRKIQDEIVTYLARAITEFESLILTATNAITLLKERRAALISAAVTGKIDVRAQSKVLAA